MRLARAARTVTNNEHYRKISQLLTQNQKQLIDRILEPNDDKVMNKWTWFSLKPEPKSPTSNNIKNVKVIAIKLVFLLTAVSF